MKILIISRGLPNAQYPMNGIFEFDQALALQQSGADVVYFAIDIRSIRRKRKLGISQEQRCGIQCVTISIPVGAAPWRVRAWIARMALRKLYARVFGAQGKPDIIHAHFTFPGYIAAQLSREQGIPLVVTEHSSAMNQHDLRKSNMIMACGAYHQAIRVIAVSKALAGKIQDRFGIQCSVIPNIVDTALFSYTPETNQPETVT